MSALPSTENLRIGANPRSYSEFNQLLEEIARLNHPARPDMDWRRVESLCLSLFSQNGLDLQSVCYYTLAQAHTQGVSGLSNGLHMLSAMICQHWAVLWPEQTHARLTLLNWLSERLNQVLRTLPLAYRDLATLYHIESCLQGLCLHLQTLELKHLSRMDSLWLFMQNAVTKLESMEDTQASGAVRVSLPTIEPLPLIAPLLAKTPQDNVSFARNPPTYQMTANLTPLPKPATSSGWLRQSGLGFMAGVLVTALGVGGYLWFYSPSPIAKLKGHYSAEEMQRLAPRNLEGTQAQLTQLASLPPNWALNYGQGLVEQAQHHLPATPGREKLIQQWQQSLKAAAGEPDMLDDYHLAQSRLQQLVDQLNGLDERKGQYMTVSQLKSRLYAIQQPLGRLMPLEELLRQRQEKAQDPLLEQQINQRLQQLLSRYTLIQGKSVE